MGKRLKDFILMISNEFKNHIIDKGYNVSYSFYIKCMKFSCKCNSYYGTDIVTFSIRINEKFKQYIEDKEYYVSYNSWYI